MSKKLLFRFAVLVAAMMCALGASAAEAYACYTPSNTTLTFYYDNYRASRTGTTYDLKNWPDWYYDGTNANVTKAVITSSFANARPTGTSAWFGGMNNLQSITGMSYLNTSEVTNMSCMFADCYALQSLDVSHFNTAKVAYMDYMFRGCELLTSLDVSNFNTAKVTTMESMFDGLLALTSLDVSNFNTSLVTNMHAMFWDCKELTSVDVSSFNTSNVTDMSMMFCSCHKLANLDVSRFNTSNVTKMNRMFNDCYQLTSLDLSNFNTSNVTDMGWMFFSCNRLKTIYVGDGWSTAAVTDSDLMFIYCDALVGGKGTTYNANHVDASYAHIDGGTANPGYFTEKEPEAYACYTPSNTTLTFYYDIYRSSRTGTTYDLNTCDSEPSWMIDSIFTSVTHVVFNPSFANARPTATNYWFFGMYNLESITGMSYLNTSEVTNMNGMFFRCSKLASLDLSSFNTSNVTSMNGMFRWCESLTSLDLSSFNTAKVTDMKGVFEECRNLTSLDLSSFNTANVTNMSHMFYYCISLTALNVSNFSTSKVTDMSYMFTNCCSLTRLDLVDLNTGVNNFVTTNVTKMSNMFSACSALTSLNLGSFNTSKVTSMNSMFDGCSALKRLVLENFNTAKVTDMSYMFRWCHSLTSLDLSSFNTASVTSMQGMFKYCSSLTYLDLSSFNTAKVTDMSHMFNGCSNLTTISVGNGWSTAAVTSANPIFMDCNSLVGDKGTTYDPNHIGKAYAHIDGGPSNPGYLSEKKDAYAVYTSGNTTLTFYYDKLKSTRTGKIYDLSMSALTTNTLPGWYNDGTRQSVTRVVFDPSFDRAYPITTYCWFSNMNELVSITGMNYLHTDLVVTMRSMFAYCEKLTNVDVSHFKTASVGDMVTMFSNCRALTSLDLSSFNTDEVTVMGYMFYGCRALTSLDLSNFNTAKVRFMDNMFSNCTNLTTIYVGVNWNTDKVTNSTSMFSGSTKLVGGQGTTYSSSHTDKTYAHIDGGTTDPGYLTAVLEPYTVYTPDDATLTFYYDTQQYFRPGMKYVIPNKKNIFPGWLDLNEEFNSSPVTRVVFDSSFAEARPTTTYCWLALMENLHSISGKEYLNTSEVTDMSYMFYQCFALTSLDLSYFNTAKVTDMSYMFSQCSNLSTIYVGSGWSTAAVTASSNMFFDCESLVGGQGTTYDGTHNDATYAHIDGGTANPGYFTEAIAASEAYAVYTEDNTTLTFYYDNQRSSRSGTTYGLNLGSEGMEWHETSYFITQVVFDPSFADVRPTTTSQWFEGMSNVRSITGLEYLNTDSVTDMSKMFSGCRSLTNVDLSHFNTSNVTSMYFMFAECRALTSLDLSNFNTDNVTTMECMFLYCMGLTSVDLSGFTNARVTRTSNMFEGCYALTTIYADNGWSLPANNYSYAMFADCTNLVGGKGTTFDQNHTDAEYARIDGGPSNPGYFTAKSAGQHGDVNGDGNVNISDVTALTNLLLSVSTPPSTADINEDGIVNISDLTALINNLLSSTSK